MCTYIHSLAPFFLYTLQILGTLGLQPVCQFSSDSLTPFRHFSPHNCPSQDIFCFVLRVFVNPKDGCNFVKVSRLWNTPACLAPTAMLTTFKVTLIPLLHRFPMFHNLGNLVKSLVRVYQINGCLQFPCKHTMRVWFALQVDARISKVAYCQWETGTSADVFVKMCQNKPNNWVRWHTQYRGECILNRNKTHLGLAAFTS